MKKHNVWAAIAAAASMAAAFPALAQSVQNGDFSDAYLDPVTQIPAPLGWMMTGNFSDASVAGINNQFEGSNVTASPDGGRMLAVWSIGQQPDSASQTLSGLTIGDQYTVSFYENAADRRGADYSGISLDWQVSLGSQTLSSTPFAGPKSDSSSGWTKVDLSFTATAATAILKFLAHSSAPVAPEPLVLLDGVTVTNTTVTPVPEPGTYALMFVGLACIGVVARRRQAA
jgi:PEP-CTERM motif